MIDCLRPVKTLAVLGCAEKAVAASSTTKRSSCTRCGITVDCERGRDGRFLAVGVPASAMKTSALASASMLLGGGACTACMAAASLMSGILRCGCQQITQ